MKKFIAIVFVPVAVACGESSYDFAVIGDLPYGTEGIARLPSVVRDINGADVEWVLHIGDIKSGGALCSDSLLRERFGFFQGFTHPFIFVPGDNEWTDCHRLSNGPYPPLDRLAFIRSLFYSVPGATSGSVPMQVEVQSDNPDFSEFVEHQRWTRGGVVFMTLHVVGSWNANEQFEGRTEADDEAAQRRERAVIAWMVDGFRVARESNAPGVVIGWHANPQFDDPFPPSGIRPPDSSRVGFEAILETLEAQVEAFRRPVLLIHGDTHYFRVDKPLYNPATNRRLENFTRLETFGAPDFHWISVSVDPDDPQVFEIRPELIPENFEGYP